MPIDFNEDTKAPQSSDSLKLMADYGDELEAIDEQIAYHENQVKQLALRKDQLQLEIIPDLMASLGLKDFTLSDGSKVKVDPFLRGSIPSESAIAKADDLEKPALEARRAACFTWLAKEGAESIIKGEVVIAIPKGAKAMAVELVNKLRAEGKSAAFQEEVNFQTLNAYLRERQKQGKDIPVEPFNLFVGNKATIKAAK